MIVEPGENPLRNSVPETVAPTDAVGVIVMEITSVPPAGTMSGLNDVPIVSDATVSGVEVKTAGSKARVTAVTVVVSVPWCSPPLGYGPMPDCTTFHSPALTPPG